MLRATVVFAIGCTAATLPAQLSGSYLIDPAGAPPNYTSFQNAVNAAAAAGISGPVVFNVLPGTYTESVSIPVIAGASTTNTITFKSLVGPGTVMLNGSTGDTFAFTAGIATARNGYVVFDGLDFVGAPGWAIYAGNHTEFVEVKNCTFGPNHRPATGSRDGIMLVEHAGSEGGWNVHHCQFTFPNRLSRSSYGIYLSNGGFWAFHDNVVDLNGCTWGLYMINSNRRLDKVYNNLFYGSLYASTSTSANQTAVIRADVSNYDNDFVHNSFFVHVPGTTGSIIASSGLGGTSPATNRMYGNVFYVTGPGTCITLTMDTTTGLPRPFFSDGNVFWAPNGEIGRLGPGNAGLTTLAAWQAATGMDAASIQADPMFRNAAATPPDLRPLPGSPAQGRAVNTPSYVTTDFAGRLRDSQPDAGAYEMSGFAVYGQGCPGTGSSVPAIVGTGTVALGSVTFSIDLQNALPNVLSLLMGGFSRTAYNSVPLPFAIGGGCEILAAPQILLFTVSGATGAASVPLPIPNNPALLGLDTFWQWGVLDPAAPNAFGLALSNGGALQL